MPIIPRYESKQNVRATPAAPLAEGFDQQIKDIGKVNKTLGEIGQTLNDAHDVIQSNKALDIYGTAAAQIELDASKDINSDNAPVYIKRYDQAKKAALEDISNRTLADNLNAELDHKNRIASANITAHFWKLKVAEGIVSLERGLDKDMRDLLLTEPGSAERAEAELNIKDRLDENVEGRIITQEKADEMYKKSMKTAIQFEILRDKSVEEEDSTIFKSLDKDDSVLSKKLDPTTRKELLKESQQRIFQNNRSVEREIKKAIKDEKIIQKQNEARLAINMANTPVQGSDFPADVKEALIRESNNLAMQGLITPEFSQAYNDLLTNPKALDAGVKKYPNIAKFSAAIFNADNDEEKEEALIDLMKKGTSGQMNISKIQTVLKVAFDESREDAGVIGNIINSFRSWSEAGPMDEDRLTESFLRGVGEGKDPEKAREEAIEEEQITVNPNRTEWEKGKTYPTNMGMMTVTEYNPITGDPIFKRAK